MAKKEKTATLTADQIRDRAIGEFESQVSQQLANLPLAPYTVQVTGFKEGFYNIRVGNSREANLLAHTVDMLTEHNVWLIVTLTKGQIYDVPPPPPVVDMDDINKRFGQLQSHNERLSGKLTAERLASAGWEAKATLAIAKLARIRLMTLADWNDPDNDPDFREVE